MNRPRKQIYTNDMYLGKIKDGDIRNDSDTQRLFVWSNEQINELIVTVLAEDYIPPIILAEVDNSQLWIVDGGQRSASLNRFRYGNYKITSAIENSIISYKAKIVDVDGNITWEDATFDIKNKTYDKLPEELKKKFNEYQIETAIHEDCDAHRIAQLIKRYNNHTSMNTNQKAFTYIDNFAGDVREILNSRFFLDCGVYTEKERTKGVLERVVLESIMCMFHFSEWKKQTKQIASYLNSNASQKEFDKFKCNIQRLENVITEDLKDMFDSKDSFIWLTLYNKFVDFGLEDGQFVAFLKAFKSGLKEKYVEGTCFAELDKNKGTKDKSVITAKLSILDALVCEFLDIDKDDFVVLNILSFVQENVSKDIIEEDVELYGAMLEDLTNGITNNKLLSRKNMASLIAIIAFACKNDIDLDGWIKDYFDKNSDFFSKQTENYIYMKDDLEKYIGGEIV